MKGVTTKRVGQKAQSRADSEAKQAQVSQIPALEVVDRRRDKLGGPMFYRGATARNHRHMHAFITFWLLLTDLVKENASGRER